MLVPRFRSRALFLLIAVTSLASGADPFYIGTWKIVTATPAPWAEKAYDSDAAEMKSLVGLTFQIQAAQITGPKILACKGPKYKVKEYAADMLFQGSFGEMHDKDKSADPVKIAAKLGFQGKTFKTLETGCGNELDYHFVDPATAKFGLNNYVYTLKKQ